MKKIFLLIVIWLALGQVVVANGQPKLYAVIWHGLTAQELQAVDIDSHLAIALLNTRIGGGNPQNASYLSISSGARAFAPSNDIQAVPRNKVLSEGIAGDVYFRRTGKPPLELVIPGINGIIREFAQANYPLGLGVLNDNLRAANKRIAAFGSSDTPSELFRPAALVALDQWGRIGEGVVDGHILRRDDEYPFGVRTDYEALFNVVIASEADVIIVDLGDPYRLEQYANNLLEDTFEKTTKKIRNDATDFLNKLHTSVAPNDRIILLSPFPGESRANGGLWLALAAELADNPGLLVSPTTRWPGVITNMDIGPTILQHFQIGYEQMTGRPYQVFASEGGLDQLIALEQRILTTHQNRPTVLRALVGTQIVAYLVALALLIVPLKVVAGWVILLQLGLTLLLTVPLALLVYAAHPLWTLLAMVVVIIVFYRLGPLRAIMSVALATATTITIDILTGYSLIRFSFLGYDPIAGARYYGIGNEYMGILIGATIMGWVLLQQQQTLHKQALLDALLFTAILVVIAHPSFGANVGGAITASLAFALTWLGLRCRRLSAKLLVVPFVVAILALGGLMLVDSLASNAEQSHIGTTVRLLRENPLEAAGQIILRKLSMNVKLFRYSIWSRALVVAIAAMGASFIWPSRFIAYLRKNYPKVAKGLLGTLVASVAALVFNDSGVVAAATCIFFAATTMLCLALALKHDLLSS